jgi:UDP-N-acetylmuramyl pentapeptide phosphotransferase/UDP-N-acetylglucosamine-1-phosphate transferase
MSDALAAITAAFSVAFGTSLLIVLTQRWHGRLTFDSDVGAQKFHERPTPRVGGIAVYLGVTALFLLAPEPGGSLLAPMLAAGAFALLAGLAEDLTKRVGVLARLLATIGSGLVACIATGYWLTAVDVPIVDPLLAWPVFAIPFTAVAIGGVANALNIVDGFNGLAAGTAIIILGGLATVAQMHGDAGLALAATGVAAVMAGFMLVNFPGGRLFLGDGGAYFLGFVIAWFAVLLAERNPGVSPWAGIMVCAYPVLEMFFSMWRKTRRDGHHLSRPDGLHMHMLIHRRVVGRVPAVRSADARNAMTSPFCWLLALVPVALAILLAGSSVMLVAAFAACAGLYSALYARLTQFRWCLGPITIKPAARSA